MTSPTTRPWRTAWLCAALALQGCAAQQVYRDAFEGTRGALDAVRRAGPDAVDPEAVRQLTASATEGAREGLGIPEDLDTFATNTARHAAAGAVMGVADGLSGGLTPALAGLVETLQARLAGSQGRPGLVASVIDDAQPRLERLTRAELLLVRAQWAAMLRETRSELSGTTTDLDRNLQAAVRANGQALGLALRDSILPAVGEGLTRSVAPAAEELSRKVARGASRGLEDGMRQGLTPAVTELREAVIHGPRHTNHVVWALVAVIGVLMVGLGTVLAVFWKSLRRVLQPPKLGAFALRARPALGRARGRRGPPRRARPPSP